MKNETALSEYKELIKGEELSALERLRFYFSLCSLTSDDWLDSEQLFDDVEDEIKKAAWKPLTDVQWMSIVNHDHAFDSYDKEDAVHEAVKMVEAILEENNQ